MFMIWHILVHDNFQGDPQTLKPSVQKNEFSRTGLRIFEMERKEDTMLLGRELLGHFRCGLQGFERGFAEMCPTPRSTS